MEALTIKSNTTNTPKPNFSGRIFLFWENILFRIFSPQYQCEHINLPRSELTFTMLDTLYYLRETGIYLNGIVEKFEKQG